MKNFNYCISNPPYQTAISTHLNGRIQYTKIYDKFQKLSNKIAIKTIMIYPASWVSNLRMNFGKYLINNGLKNIDSFNGNEIFGKSIAKNYPIAIVHTIKKYDKEIFINNIPNPRETSYYTTSKINQIIYNIILPLPKIKNRAHNLTNLKNIQTNPSIFKNNPTNMTSPIKIYIKEKPGVQPDSRNYYIEEKNLQPYLINSSIKINQYHVAMPFSFFKQGRLFALIINNPYQNFNLKIFEPNYIFGTTYINLKTFPILEEAENFKKYFDTRLITLIACLKPSYKYFMSLVPELQDYSNNNPLFKTDEDLGINHEYYNLTLEERLYKLFGFEKNDLVENVLIEE